MVLGVGEVPKKEQNYPWKVGLISAHVGIVELATFSIIDDFQLSGR
jgi:hypothetical protein